MRNLSWLMLGFFSSVDAYSLTNATVLSQPLPAVVRLAPLNVLDQKLCTGTIVGANPLVVLTALHCVADLETASVLLLPEKAHNDENAKKEVYKQKHTSSHVFFSEEVLQSEEYVSYKESLEYTFIAKKRIESSQKELEEAQRSGASDLELERLKKLAFIRYETLSSFEETKSESLSQIFLNEALMINADLAFLVFENTDRLPESLGVEQLVKEKRLIPLDFSETYDKQVLMVAGYGQNSLEDFRPSQVLKASATFLQKPGVPDVLVTYGLEKTISSEVLPLGTMSSILPGDSGAPLLSENGIVGISVRSAELSTMSESAPTRGWPLNPRFQRYLYVHNEYIASRSMVLADVLESLRADGFDVLEQNEMSAEINFSETLGLSQEIIEQLP